MAIVHLQPNSFFGGENAVENQHGTMVHYCIVGFVVPAEPSQRVTPLITKDAQGKPRILVTVTTTRRALTESLFGAMSQYHDPEMLDFDIGEPKGTKKDGTPKQTGWMNNYPGKPGQSGFALPEDFGDAWREGVTEQDSGGDWGTEYGGGSDSHGAEGEVPLAGGSNEDAPHSPPGIYADADDWTVAMEAFHAGSRAPIRVAYRKKYGVTVESIGGDGKMPIAHLEELMADAG